MIKGTNNDLENEPEILDKKNDHHESVNQGRRATNVLAIEEDESKQETRSSLSERGTSVGMSSGKKNTMIIVVILVLAYLVKAFYSSVQKDRIAKKSVYGKHKTPEEVHQILQSNSYKVVNDDGSRVSVLPSLPDLPTIEVPKAPPPPKLPEGGQQPANPKNVFYDSVFDNKSSPKEANKSDYLPQKSRDIAKTQSSPQNKIPFQPPAPTSIGAPIPGPTIAKSSGAGSGRVVFGQDKMRKYAAPMVAYGEGAQSTKASQNVGSPSYSSNGDSGAFIASVGIGNSAQLTEGNPIARTAAPQITNSYLGLSDRIIRQGTMIDIILESEIDTDLPAIIRGILDKDVFSRNGKNILLPRGSTVIGSYTASSDFGQVRLGITWNRLMRPDGVDVIMDLPAVDQLGRSGVIADAIDDKIIAAAKSAVLFSTITVANTAVKGMVSSNQSTNNTIQNTTSTYNSSNNSSSASPTTSSDQSSQQDSTTQGQMNSGVDQIAQQTKQAFVASLNSTIHIDHGRKVQAMVNKDIILLGNTAFIYEFGGQE